VYDNDLLATSTSGGFMGLEELDIGEDEDIVVNADDIQINEVESSDTEGYGFDNVFIFSYFFSLDFFSSQGQRTDGNEKKRI
jgi:hypothetical protein